MEQNSFNKLVNQDLRTSVIFARENGSSQFSYPLPLSPKPPQKDLSNSVLHHVIQGTFCIADDTAVAPLERIHHLMQNQNEMMKSGRLSTPYNGMKDCFLRTIKQGFDLAIIKYNWGADESDIIGKIKFNFAVTGATLFQYPLDYARTRLANNVKVTDGTQICMDSAGKNLKTASGNRQFTGVFNVYKKTWKSSGFLGPFRGYNLSICGILGWDLSKKMIEAHYSTEKLQESHTMLPMILPELMLLCIPVALYPMASVSRRMMMTSGEAVKYKNSVRAVREIIKQEGYSSLYKGLPAGMIHCVARICAADVLARLACFALGESK